MKAAVQSVWRRRMQKDLTEPTLTNFANEIAGGGSVHVNVTVK